MFLNLETAQIYLVKGCSSFVSKELLVCSRITIIKRCKTSAEAKTGILMECVHQICSGDWAVGSDINILTPRGSSKYNNVMWIVCTNSSDDLLMIGLDTIPRYLKGFVEDLIDDVWIRTIFLRHGGKEFNSLIRML